MIIYWLIWLEVIIANFLFIRPRMESKILFGITMVFLFIFIGFRYQIGGDWSNYLEIYDYFNDAESISSIFITDPGYGLLNYISQKNGFTDTIFVNAVCSLVVIFCLTQLAFKLKYYWLVLLSYFPYHLVAVSMGYTRQSVAIALSLLYLYYLLQKKLLRALVYLSLAVSFHSTAIVLLLFFPIIFFEFVKNSKLYNYIYFVFSMIFLISCTFYFSDSSDNIYIQNEVSSAGFFARWVYHIIPLLLLIVYRNELKNNTVERRVIFFMGFIVFFVLILGMFFSTLADRFNLYFIFFDLFIITFVYDKMINNKHRVLLLFSLILFYTVSFYLWMFYGEWASRAWIPYQNYISNYFFQEVF